MIDPHKHCPVCSTPMPLDETTCSTKCQKTLDDRHGQVKKGKLILHIAMVIVLILVAYIMFFM
jgi:predicted nucleic acid-binding Zn ribbon protein